MAPISNITMIPLSNLLFDPENPRLPKEFRGNRDEKAIIKHMLRDESLIELMKSIGHQLVKRGIRHQSHFWLFQKMENTSL